MVFLSCAWAGDVITASAITAAVSLISLSIIALPSLIWSSLGLPVR